MSWPELTTLEWVYVLVAPMLMGLLKGWQDHIMRTDMNADSDKKYAQPIEVIVLEEQNWFWRWYHSRFNKRLYKEKFPFSVTALVFLTSRWHWLGTIRVTVFYIGIAIMAGWIWIVPYAIAQRWIGFTISYDK